MQPQTWHSDGNYTEFPKITFTGWLRVARRGLPVLVLLCVGLLTLYTLRLIERPFFGQGRPWTPSITRFVCRNALRLMGIRFETEGQAMQDRGAVVANHSSWMDILTLNAADRLYFVSKSEVAGWPGIGTLAKATGTVFIARDRKEAKAQQELFESRLKAGHKLLFFPEGTSTDSLRVLDFRSTLFAAFMTDELKPFLKVQPVSVNYIAPKGADPRFFGWWGDMDFGAHMIQMLAARNQGHIKVVYHAPVTVAEFANRKLLAKATQDKVRAGHLISAHSQENL